MYLRTPVESAGHWHLVRPRFETVLGHGLAVAVQRKEVRGLGMFPHCPDLRTPHAHTRPSPLLVVAEVGARHRAPRGPRNVVARIRERLRVHRRLSRIGSKPGKLELCRLSPKRHCARYARRSGRRAVPSDSRLVESWGGQYRKQRMVHRTVDAQLPPRRAVHR